MFEHSIVSISPLVNFNAFSIMLAKTEEGMPKLKGEVTFEEECYNNYYRSIDGGLNDNGEATIFVKGAIYEAHPFVALWCDLSVPSIIDKIVKFYKSDSKCKSLRIVFNTGGGCISTIPELADAIYNFGKPTIAEVREQCCSAGYWLASQCDSIVASRGATIGALGVYIAILDSSVYEAKNGFKTHLITTSELKGLGEQGLPLTEAQQKFLQTYVNRSGEMFLADIKRKRPSFDVDLFNGAFWHAEDALDLGVIDDVLI
jgi:ClpP class serine protease